MIINNHHLTYCTNIHPGESWDEVIKSLQKFVPTIKSAVAPDAPFGIGLRLSNQASEELMKENNLDLFKEWLSENECYVFTFNGFPYGGFHRQVVKDEVHSPDWSTRERLDYTLRLFNILAELVPGNIEGGISTSPVSYKYWHSDEESIRNVKQQAARHMAEVAAYLFRITRDSGKTLHLDIEPEPDGVIENTQEVIDFYNEWLIPEGAAVFKKEFELSAEKAEKHLKEHIRICYDVCHVAVVYEQPEDVFKKLAAEGIRIGKIQISAALKAQITQNEAQKSAVRKAFLPFVESTYLHQVVEKAKNGELIQYRDLPEALETFDKEGEREWRTHFHVPVFLDQYGQLYSTQEDILQVLSYIKQNEVTDHLEVETYTWEVLPDDIRMELSDSIIRELQWVKRKMKSER
jgi:hypothetical protein